MCYEFEGSIDNARTDRTDIKPFHVHCPRCGFSTSSVENHWLRLKLRLKGIAEPLELDPICERIKNSGKRKGKITAAERTENQLAIMEMNEALSGSDAFSKLQDTETIKSAQARYR